MPGLMPLLSEMTSTRSHRLAGLCVAINAMVLIAGLDLFAAPPAADAVADGDGDVGAEGAGDVDGVGDGEDVRGEEADGVGDGEAGDEIDGVAEGDADGVPEDVGDAEGVADDDPDGAGVGEGDGVPDGDGLVLVGGGVAVTVEVAHPVGAASS